MALAPPPAALTVRPYAPRDLRACALIFHRAWHAGHPHMPRAITRDTFLRETGGEAVLVAEGVEEDGTRRIVGFAGLHEPAAFVHHLYVDPAHRGRGVGRALLRVAAGRLGPRRRLSLKCQLRNLGALAFYQHLGWTPGETGDEGAPGAWVRLWAPLR